MSEEMKRSYTPTTIDEYNKIVDGAFILKSPEETKDDSIRNFALRELQILEKKCLDDESEPPEEREEALRVQKYMSACILHMLDACSDCGFSGSTIGYAIGMFNRLISCKPVSEITKDDFSEVEPSFKHIESPNEVVCRRVSPPIWGTRLHNGNIVDIYACGMIHIDPKYHASYIMGGKGRPKTILDRFFSLPTSSCKQFPSLPIPPKDLKEETVSINCYQEYLRGIYYDYMDMLDKDIRAIPAELSAGDNELATSAFVGEMVERPEKIKSVTDVIYSNGTLFFAHKDEQGVLHDVYSMFMHGTYNGEHDLEEAINFMRSMRPVESFGIPVDDSMATLFYGIVDYTISYAAHNDCYGDNHHFMLPLIAQRSGLSEHWYSAMFPISIMKDIVQNVTKYCKIDFEKIGFHYNRNGVWYSRTADPEDASMFFCPTLSEDEIIKHFFEEMPTDESNAFDAYIKDTLQKLTADNESLKEKILNFRAAEAHQHVEAKNETQVWDS